jgi:abequosyltransferase
MKSILTICIPTYNRSEYLKICLNSIKSNIYGIEDYVEIYVSDNNSNDDTELVVDSFINTGMKIYYNKHKQNIGTELNFISLYEKVNTKYFWILCDDDFILPNKLLNIINILKKDDYGLIYMNQIWYDNIHDIKNNFNKFETVEIKDHIDFITKINYWITFLSGIIVNKSIIDKELNHSQYNGTMLNYLIWFLPNIFKSPKNLIIKSVCLGCKANNTGGYMLYRVFGKNFNFILKDMINKKIISEKCIDIINNSLLNDFFPKFINDNNSKFYKENYILTLLPDFWTYKMFWKNIVLKSVLNSLNIRYVN